MVLDGIGDFSVGGWLHDVNVGDDTLVFDIGIKGVVWDCVMGCILLGLEEVTDLRGVFVRAPISFCVSANWKRPSRNGEWEMVEGFFCEESRMYPALGVNAKQPCCTASS